MHIKEINIKNRVNHYLDNLIQSKKIGTKNISIDEKNYKDLVIYFTSTYVHKKSIKMLRLYYNELIGKIEECLMVDDCYIKC